MTTVPTEHPTGLESGPPVDPDAASDAADLRAQQVARLGAAIASTLELVFDAEAAIEGIDDLAPLLDEVPGVEPLGFDHMGDPWTEWDDADLDLPPFVHETLAHSRPLQMHRAALVVYLDALNRQVSRLKNMQGYLGIADDELDLGGHTCGVPSAYEVLSPGGTAWVQKHGLTATSTEQDMQSITDRIIALGDTAYRADSVYPALVKFRDDLRRAADSSAADAGASR